MKSIQSVHGESTETELLTKGFYEINNDSFLISYEDTEATGFKGSVTEISVKADRYASVIRSGSSSSDLIMERGKKHHCQYQTPYGAMDIGIYTHFIKNNLLEDGGTLHLKYTLDINSSYMSDNEIIVTVNIDK
jgi:uncharacterized beta-barrel protein YwiB (DUF1934 family)